VERSTACFHELRNIDHLILVLFHNEFDQNMLVKSDNLRGAFFMSISMAAFISNDAIMKIVAPQMGLAQAMFVRGIFCSIFIAMIFSVTVRNINQCKSGFKKVVGRSFFDLVATIFFLTALLNMPFANVNAILQALPLVVTIAASLFLKEKFGRKRTVAIIIGLIGVLLIIKPGTEGFNIYSILAIGAVLSVTCRDLLTRAMPIEIPTIFVSLVTSLVVTSSSGFYLAANRNWQFAEYHLFGQLALSGLFLMMGYFCSVEAMRHGSVAFVSPFRYTLMVWALLIGFFVFNDVPDYMSLLGMFLIIGTGLFTLYREAKLKEK